MKKVKEGYRISEKGIVPIEWAVESFNRCISIKNGQVDPKIEPYCNMPHIGPGNIEKFTGKLLRFNTAKEDMQTSGKYLFDEEDVLYGKINPQLGKVAYPKFKGVCSADMYPLRANKDVLTPLYLKYLLLSQDFFKYSVSVSMRTGMPKINRDELSEYRLLLPMVNEQEKISSILSSVDEQIEIIDNLIEKTKELKKGLMQKLLTKGIGHSRFKDTEIGRIPEEWEVKTMEDVILSTQLGTNTLGKGNVSNGIPILKMGNLTIGGFNFSTVEYIENEELDINKDFILNKGDFLFNTRNTLDLVGKSGVWNNQLPIAIFNSNIMRIKYKLNVDSFYMSYYFENSEGWKFLKSIATGTTSVAAIYTKDLMKVKVKLPDIKEQKQIVAILSSVDEQIDQYESKKEKLQELKKGLMQKLLTGKIRVKVN